MGRGTVTIDFEIAPHRPEDGEYPIAINGAVMRNGVGTVVNDAPSVLTRVLREAFMKTKNVSENVSENVGPVETVNLFPLDTLRYPKYMHTQNVEINLAAQPTYRLPTTAEIEEMYGPEGYTVYWTAERYRWAMKRDQPVKRRRLVLVRERKDIYEEAAAQLYGTEPRRVAMSSLLSAPYGLGPLDRVREIVAEWKRGCSKEECFECAKDALLTIDSVVNQYIPGDRPVPECKIKSDRMRYLIGTLCRYSARMSYNEAYFGEPEGHLKRTLYELHRIVDPIYPQGPLPGEKEDSFRLGYPTLSVPVRTSTMRFVLPPTGEPFESKPCGLSDKTLRELQVTLPWTVRYSEDFRANRQSHKDFAHALHHIFKAGGKLAGFVDDMDHDRNVADGQPGLTYGKYIADLVVCALRLANTMPSGPVDLHAAVVNRIVEKNP
ncbi:MAG TPA: hypothetical protein VGB05_10700 [Pyrinomonadaceae bacterium]|jgi:hypothetical protein